MSTHPKFGIGGSERQMMLIGKHLTEMNTNFVYITQKQVKSQKKEEIIDGLKIHTFGTRLNPFNGVLWKKIYNLINYSDILIFFKGLRNFNWDIYHLMGANIITGIWAFFAKYIKRRKFLFTVASIKDCIPKSYPWGNLTYKIYEYGLKKADVVIVLADYMKKELKNNYGIDSIVIKSGHIIPEEPFKKSTPPIILWISRLIELKQPELFLKIAKELQDLDAQFLLIGPQSYKKDEIMKFAQNSKNFSFIPGVPAGKDNYFYERASILINTSTYEGFPNTFIQAWLHKTPVISLNVDPDCIICKNELGYHAKGDINDLIKKTREFIEDPTKLKRLSSNCREYAIKNYDIKTTAKKHYKLYKFVLKE